MAWEPPPGLRGRTLVKLGRGSFNLMTPSGAHFLFDGEGRLWSAWRNGWWYRRGVDGRVMRLSPRGASREVDWPDAAERRLFYESAARAAAAAVYVASRGEAVLYTHEGPVAAVRGPEVGERAATMLGRASRWSASRLEAESARFGAVYSTIGMVPPDQYLSVVMQVADGCPYNACGFCSLYRDTRFRVRGGEELARHASAVRGLFGGALPMRNSVFLGAGDALAAGRRALLDSLRLASMLFPDQMSGAQGRGASAFASSSSVMEIGDALAGLRAAGLASVFVGVESGSQRVLDAMRKPGVVEDAARAVRLLKKVGVAVRLSVLAGVDGGLGEEHLAETSSLVRSLPLGAGDIVYISPLCEPPRPPSAFAMQQALELQRCLALPHRAPVVAPYRVDTFVY